MVHSKVQGIFCHLKHQRHPKHKVNRRNLIHFITKCSGKEAIWTILKKQNNGTRSLHDTKCYPRIIIPNSFTILKGVHHAKTTDKGDQYSKTRSRPRLKTILVLLTRLRAIIMAQQSC